MSSLGAELPMQMARATRRLVMAAESRHLVIGDDTALTDAIEFGLQAVDRAAEAIATQDVVAYLRCHEALKVIGA